MTNSTRARGTDKRRRLTAAAAEVVHHQGAERTTIADIAKAADVPVGNVYYYFKTKDDLVQAALSEHAEHLSVLTETLGKLPSPRQRLKAMVAAWVDQRETAARYGCPTGSLATELSKREDDELTQEAGRVMRLLLAWSEKQFRELGLDAPEDLALSFVGAYQGMSVLANALRDPEIMTRQSAALTRWIDSLTQP
ncbi:TetR/AcrR family transcriptional regulator [Actinomadura rupiterrae]|uniref:TetR/AcrR family transcriptional regulator n=1 Tax=Actinomadura rupiterrae TaxID=559627 RepID=UPI0020A25C5B|nr:TetR/AcrR family transcriptional regulator [Actinomadura rupiterrae]MCP2335403.1 AcrR family transcriptional regulator [Actinomadura rupiterrae]